jgi:hypothetical protein
MSPHTLWNARCVPFSCFLTQLCDVATWDDLRRFGASRSIAALEAERMLMGPLRTANKKRSSSSRLVILVCKAYPCSSLHQPPAASWASNSCPSPTPDRGHLSDASLIVSRDRLL